MVHPHASHLSTIKGREFFRDGEEFIPVDSLARILGLPDTVSDGEKPHNLVIIQNGNKKYALYVHQVSGAQDIVVRSLGPQLKEVRFIIGVAVLNHNTVVPVLDMGDVFEGLQSRISSPVRNNKRKETVYRRKKILIAEDSITSRMLLKNILESAGYEVETAVDGLEAYTKLMTTPVDLVLSDVDMPRMNGFVLTEKIRSEKKMANLPVILVTSLDSREDREHGLMVGADAYIVKSGFDQGNLLEAIQRLIVPGKI